MTHEFTKCPKFSGTMFWVNTVHNLFRRKFIDLHEVNYPFGSGECEFIIAFSWQVTSKNRIFRAIHSIHQRVDKWRLQKSWGCVHWKQRQSYLRHGVGASQPDESTERAMHIVRTVDVVSIIIAADSFPRPANQRGHH